MTGMLLGVGRILLAAFDRPHRSRHVLQPNE